MAYVVPRVPRAQAPESAPPVAATKAPCGPRVSLPVVPEAADASAPLEAQLRARTAPGVLWERDGQGLLRCTACAHRCVLGEGRTGSCGVRFEQGGELRVPWGYVARRYVRAVETNTLYHVRPGARALTFGMYGCDLRCPYCHNHQVSQALRDGVEGERVQERSPAELVREAVEAGCEVLCGAYNEPLLAAEWAYALFEEAKRAGMLTAVVTDGHSTPETLAYLRPVLDVFRVDLKAGTKDQYKALGGRLGPVLESIERARSLGYWVEVVTLVVPGFNDAPGELRALGDTLRAIDPEMPWHLNAFYPRYRMQERLRTEALALVAAAGAAMARGQRYVYASNLADELTGLQHTRCPGCARVLVERQDYRTVAVHLRDGACDACGARLPGLWGAAREGERAEWAEGELP